jgi:hypothetical protein
MWQSLQAMLRINRFWGIIVFGWVPLASLVAAFTTAIAGAVYWYFTDSKSKKGLLGAQVSSTTMHAKMIHSCKSARCTWATDKICR